MKRTKTKTRSKTTNRIKMTVQMFQLKTLN